MKLREGREERMMLELAVLKLVRPELDDGTGALLRRIEKLERDRVAAPAPPQSVPTPAAAPTARPSPGAAPEPHPTTQREAAVESPDRDAAGRVAAAAPPPRGPPDIDVASPTASAAPEVGADRPPTSADLDRIWPQLMAGVREQLGYRRAALFRDAIPGGVEGFTLVFTVPAVFHLEQLSTDAELKRYLAERAAGLLGGRFSVSFRAADGSVPASHSETAEEPAPEPLPDKESLIEAPSATTDAFSLLEEKLGARVVEEG